MPLAPVLSRGKTFPIFELSCDPLKPVSTTAPPPAPAAPPCHREHRPAPDETFHTPCARTAKGPDRPSAGSKNVMLGGSDHAKEKRRKLCENPFPIALAKASFKVHRTVKPFSAAPGSRARK